MLFLCCVLGEFKCLFYDLAKVSLERTRLQNKFLQSKTDQDIISYAKKQKKSRMRPSVELVGSDALIDYKYFHNDGSLKAFI